MDVYSPLDTKLNASDREALRGGYRRSSLPGYTDASAPHLIVTYCALLLLAILRDDFGQLDKVGSVFRTGLSGRGWRVRTDIPRAEDYMGLCKVREGKYEHSHSSEVPGTLPHFSFLPSPLKAALPPSTIQKLPQRAQYLYQWSRIPVIFVAPFIICPISPPLSTDPEPFTLSEDVPAQSWLITSLERSRHVEHCNRRFAGLPASLTGIDGSRMALAFYCPGTMDICGALDTKSGALECEAWRGWMRAPAGWTILGGWTRRGLCASPGLARTRTEVLISREIRFTTTPGADDADLRMRYRSFVMCSSSLTAPARTFGAL
ncbi:hypothetical protein K488DRAFT_74797 [Vararia minispora EC-137]|uniref:Uncharacterized protein n=1 Tax=Vararia minispora EC-137 TaxID=1314806 RepID=A0ACB8Q5Z6_9AGAM|nr:hypothetical protein K488DRAFT_74797 [Vararia minispora EC-137]